MRRRLLAGLAWFAAGLALLIAESANRRAVAADAADAWWFVRVDTGRAER